MKTENRILIVAVWAVVGCTSCQSRMEADAAKAEATFQREQREMEYSGYSELSAQYKELLQRFELLPDSILGELGLYRVKPGDTLATIATSRGIKVGQLASWSLITDPVRVKVGDILVVRERKQQSTKSTTAQSP